MPKSKESEPTELATNRCDDYLADSGHRILKSDIITVRVGEGLETLYVHQDVLCRESKFFQAYLQLGMFQKGERNEIELPEIDSESFHIAAEYCYTGEIQAKEMELMAKLYVVADKLLMNKFKNFIMDRFRETVSEENKIAGVSALTMVKYLAMRTDPHMRTYIIDQIAFDINNSSYLLSELEGLLEAKEALDSLEKKKILHEVLTKSTWFLERGKIYEVGNPMRLRGCLYHDHGEGDLCMEQKKFIKEQDEDDDYEDEDTDEENEDDEEDDDDYEDGDADDEDKEDDDYED